MGFQRKVLASLLIIAVVALLVVGVGFYREKKAVEVRDRSMAASGNVSSYFYTMIVSTKTKGVVDGATVDIAGSIAGNVSVDMEERFMYSPVSINIRGFSDGEPVATKSEMEMYVVDDTLYTQVGGMWAKRRLDEDAWGRTQLKQQEKVIEGAGVRLAGSEMLHGVEAYVLEFKPDVKDIMDYAVEVSGNIPTAEEGGDRVEGYTVREWISTDNFLPLKTVTDFTMVSGDVTTAMSITVEYYDYDKPVALELPEEAAGAIDMAQTTLFSP